MRNSDDACLMGMVQVVHFELRHHRMVGSAKSLTNQLSSVFDVFARDGGTARWTWGEAVCGKLIG